MKRVVSGIVNTILLIGMLVLTFNLQPVKASGTVYIRASGSVDPPTAPIQRDGDIYTLTGNISSDADGIVIERNNMMLDGAGYALQGLESGYGIYLSYRSNVTIKNIEVEAFDDGVYLYSSSNNSVFGNNITTNEEYGISFINSSNNRIFRNNLTNNAYGIYLAASSNNSISENNITANSAGIWLQECLGYNIISENFIARNYLGLRLSGSGNNVLSRNNMANNRYSFGVSGWILSHFINDVDASNTVDGRSILYLVNKQSLIIDPQTYPDIAYLAVINSINITLRHLTMENNYQGILLAYTDNSSIQNVTVTSNYYGIQLKQSSNSNITGNNLTANKERGIWLEDSVDNRISENNIANNTIGIQLSFSSNNIVSENNITAKNEFGIGISLGGSNNMIFGNSITSNFTGIQLFESSNNRIFHNNFVESPYHVLTYASRNTWDNDYPSSGNYWSDYNGTDLYSGPFQNETGCDGIGDTPYAIDENNNAKNIDRYPLMAPFSTFNAGIWNGLSYNVDFVSNSTISAFHFNPEEGAFLEFNVTGESGTSGFCRVAIPKDLLKVEDGCTVLVGCRSANYTAFSDENCAYLYFTYNHGTKTVYIIGTHVIPEFPLPFISPLFILLSLLTIILAKKKPIPEKSPHAKVLVASLKSLRLFQSLLTIFRFAFHRLERNWVFLRLRLL